MSRCCSTTEAQEKSQAALNEQVEWLSLAPYLQALLILRETNDGRRLFIDDLIDDRSQATDMPRWQYEQEYAMGMTFDATLKDLGRDCPHGVLTEFDQPTEPRVLE